MASHWPRITENSGIATYGLTVLERKMSTPPTFGKTAFGVQDLTADIQVSSPDGTSLPYSDERPGFCLR